jgi:CRP/FNR family transcriptional regulator, cyclic AMP receptor protein
MTLKECAILDSPQSLSVIVCCMGQTEITRSPAKVFPTPKKSRSKSLAFNIESFLESSGLGKSIVFLNEKDTVFRQGDRATSVFYIQKGSVKLTVVNQPGREAVLAVLGRGDFFGEGCITTQSISIATAICLAPTTLLVINKKEMIHVLHAEHAFSDYFIAYMLGRNLRVEQDLIDQLFNSSEKRLARTLLMLAQYGQQDQPNKIVANLSQETLGEMVGTTRSRVNFFMNKFRKLGFIEYSTHGIQINKSLLNVVLHD